jgi:undecaprenyl-diphosphatase
VSSSEAAILAGFAAARGDIADTLFLAVTWLGSLWVLLPLSLAVASRRSDRRLLLPAGLLATAALCHALKIAIGRPRPQLHEALIALPADAAFPSAHAAQAMAFALLAGALLPAAWRTRAVSLLLAAAMLVGLSRLHLQVHWPTDVLAGWLLGALVALAALRVFRQQPA